MRVGRSRRGVPAASRASEMLPAAVRQGSSAFAPWPSHRRAVEGDDAVRRRDQAGGDAQRSRLAASRRPDDADDLASPHLERQFAENEMIAKGEIDIAKGD
jgi:hypothetical protein